MASARILDFSPVCGVKPLFLDITLVPVQDLPLQSILFFRPCLGNAAAYYLQALCAAEGYRVDWKDIERLASDPFGRMVPNEYGGCANAPDLRATINALHMSSSGATASRREQAEETGSKDCLSLDTVPQLSVRRVDFFSFLDAYVEQDLSSKYVAVRVYVLTVAKVILMEPK